LKLSGAQMTFMDRSSCVLPRRSDYDTPGAARGWHSYTCARPCFAAAMEHLLTTYGPLAVFALLMLSGIGIPLGEDIVNIPAGMLIAHGQLNPWATLVAAYLGVVLSDCLWFGICHHYGTPLLHKRWFKKMVHPRRLLEAKHQMERRGAWMIVMARFIPASRTTAITVAGMLHLPFWKFLLATASCVCVTAPMQIGAGWLIAKGIGTKDTADLVWAIIGLAMLLVAVMLALKLWRQHRAAATKPRAKVMWLKRFRRPRLHVPKMRRRDEALGNRQ
jgi:membrane protein DedA with SNARE-associated domain